MRRELTDLERVMWLAHLSRTWRHVCHRCGFATCPRIGPHGPRATVVVTPPHTHDRARRTHDLLSFCAWCPSQRLRLVFHQTTGVDAPGAHEVYGFRADDVTTPYHVVLSAGLSWFRARGYNAVPMAVKP